MNTHAATRADLPQVCNCMRPQMSTNMYEQTWRHHTTAHACSNITASINTMACTGRMCARCIQAVTLPDTSTTQSTCTGPDTNMDMVCQPHVLHPRLLLRVAPLRSFGLRFQAGCRTAARPCNAQAHEASMPRAHIAANKPHVETGNRHSLSST